MFQLFQRPTCPLLRDSSDLKNKKIYYYVTDEWDENASREYNFETNTRYIAQSFNYFINHFIEEEE